MEIFARNIARGGPINLHISKLFGKDVEVILLADENISIEIRQAKKKMTVNLGTIQDPETIAESVRALLKSVVLDCRDRCKDYYIFIEFEEVSYLQDVFEMDGIVFDFEKCPVCLNATQTKTMCNHVLCPVCFLKCKKCPLCRATL
jgi:hypothetical protein